MHSSLPVPDTVVWIRQSRWRVESARRDGRVIRLAVTSAHRHVTFLVPFDRPASTRLRDRPQRIRRQRVVTRLAQVLARDTRWHSLSTAVRAHLDVLPYQLEPALAMIRGSARRVLIADEVGLGKTIQAGLLVAETVGRDPSARVLVLAPSALRAQWGHELRDRFHLESRVADARSIDLLARTVRSGDNPWLRPGIWIASLDYLKQPHVAQALPRRPWDLLVIDEAHGVCGDSDRHLAAADLATRSRRLVLLTATPHSGDDLKFSRLVELGTLDPHEDELQVFRRTRRDVGLRVDRHVHWQRVDLSVRETRLLDALKAFERTVLVAAGDRRRPAAFLLLSVFRKRALSTSAALTRSVEHRLAWLDGHEIRETEPWLQGRLDFGDDSDDCSADDARGLEADVGLSADRERAWLTRLRALSSAAQRDESKVARLVRMLRRSHDPVVIFTEFRDSLDEVRRRIHHVRPSVAIHGGMPAAEQQQALDAFLGGSASALIATDVAGQGLNLQSRARWVVSLELPWNPARIEQRVGRVDRIGQIRRVHLTLLVARHDAEGGILARLIGRTLAAQQVLGHDALVATSPPEIAIQGSLLDTDRGADIESSGSPGDQVRLCHQWERHAIAAARLLRTRRALFIRDEGRRPSGRPHWTWGDHLPFLSSLASRRSLLLFSVPLTDDTGAVLELHVVAVSVGIGSASPPTHRLIEMAREFASRSLGARLRRLQRLRGKEIATAIDTERALGAAIAESRSSRERQPGLFDRRDARAAERDADLAADVTRDFDMRVDTIQRGAHLYIGRPVLELMLLARR
jgi:superfamily II DNA or RNA helicase